MAWWYNQCVMNPTLKMTPKDFFLHLGATVLLYISVVSILTLAFSIINYSFPDNLAGYFYSASIAWPISMLVILVPIMYVIEWIIIKGENKDTEKKNIWIKKWRVYITLFLTGATIAGDLVVLLNTYLSGEISTRFIYKVLAVLLVSAIVFKYYFYSIHDSKWSKIVRRVESVAGIVIVLAAVVGGFIIVGSPTKQRDIRFDNQRVNDLSNIQWQIINYWQTKEALPASLGDLNNGISYFNVPKDPDTDKEYGYVVKDANSLKFSLCADFSRETQDTKGRGATGGGYYGSSYATIDLARPYGGDGNDNWKHNKGYQCFDRTIDPAIYPPNPKPLR
jgi:uncharacterized protein YhhL (DUF1145 family)